MLEATLLSLSYLHATFFRLKGLTYQQRYNGVNIDFELLNSQGNVVLNDQSEDQLYGNLHDMIVDKIVGQLNCDRFDEITESKPLKDLVTSWGLRLIDDKGNELPDMIHFDIGNDS
jgi:hypothetical protein